MLTYSWTKLNISSYRYSCAGHNRCTISLKSFHCRKTYCIIMCFVRVLQGKGQIMEGPLFLFKQQPPTLTTLYSPYVPSSSRNEEKMPFRAKLCVGASAAYSYPSTEAKNSFHSLPTTCHETGNYIETRTVRYSEPRVHIAATDEKSNAITCTDSNSFHIARHTFQSLVHYQRGWNTINSSRTVARWKYSAYLRGGKRFTMTT